MADDNGRNGRRNGDGRWMQVLIVILQTVLVLLGAEIRGTMKDHSVRIAALEIQAAKGDRWTRSEQRVHEIEMASVLTTIQLDLGKIKAKLGVD